MGNKVEFYGKKWEQINVVFVKSIFPPPFSLSIIVISQRSAMMMMAESFEAG